MILNMRNTALTLLCAGLLTGNFGCGPKDDAPAATTPPASAPTAAPPTTGADATKTPDPAVSADPTTPAKTAPAGKPGKTVKLPDGLQYTDEVVGTGVEARDGQNVIVNYTGTLTDGAQFDSSIGREPFNFLLAGGQVIKGWDEGVRGMKVGGRRKLVIPSALGYGKEGSPPKIPGGATLLFTIDLLDVK